MARTGVKFDRAPDILTLPLLGASQVSQTEAWTAEPVAVGSAGSVVAPTLVTAIAPESPTIGILIFTHT
jgi:hypothetical protein